MGYRITFEGHFSLDRKLRPEHKAYLQRFAEIKHLAMHEELLKDYPDPLGEAVGLPVGENGLYFTGMIDPNERGSDLLAYSFLDLDDLDALDILRTQRPSAFAIPSPACPWIPTRDGRGIEWDGVEKPHRYLEWLRFLLEHFLLPWGYELSGAVSYVGEQGEHGRILVTHEKVSTVVDGDSLKPRSQESPEIGEVIKIYWVTTGFVTDAARKALLDADCCVLDLHDDPPIVLVGFPYDSNYYKRHGHDDLGILSTEGIYLHSKNLSLQPTFRSLIDRFRGHFRTQKVG
jgi:hypothetical protein